MRPLRILVDEPKRAANIAKHGIDLDDAVLFEWRSCVVVPAKLGRSKAIGRLRGAIVVVIFRRLGTEGLFVISIRPAGRRERRLHEQG